MEAMTLYYRSIRAAGFFLPVLFCISLFTPVAYGEAPSVKRIPIVNTTPAIKRASAIKKTPAVNKAPVRKKSTAVEEDQAKATSYVTIDFNDVDINLFMMH